MAEGCLRRDNDPPIGVAASEPERRYCQDGGDPHSRPRDSWLDRKSLGTDELRLRYSHSGADAEILAKAESFVAYDIKSPMAAATWPQAAGGPRRRDGFPPDDPHLSRAARDATSTRGEKRYSMK